MRVRNYTKSINFTPEQIEQIKALRDVLEDRDGIRYSLAQVVLLAINQLERN